MSGNRNPQAQDGQVATVTERYNDQDSFAQLLERIGVTAAASNKLTDDDFTSMKSLVDTYHNDMDGFQSYLKGVNKTYGARSTRPIRFSPIVMKRLVATLFFFTQAVRCFHSVPDTESIDEESCGALIAVYEAHTSRADFDGDEDGIIELPELKGHSNWTAYRDKFESNLANMVGARYTPLSYVIDGTERPRITRTTPLFEVETIDMGDIDLIKSNTTHHGPQFKEDNSKVWMLLKKSLLGHQPYHHIDEYERNRDGRGAWLSLKAYYEGEDFVNRTTQECLTKLRTLHYRGETPRFGFEQFIEAQKECYKRLRDVGYNGGNGVDEATKCTNLKAMIMSDAQLETALSIARTREMFSGAFDDLVHFLKAEVDEMTMRKKQLRAASNRGRVSAVGSQPGTGRGRGRGGRGRNGGRGRGRGRGRGGRKPRTYLTRIVQGREIHNGNYPAAAFMELSREQKDAVKELRRKGEEIAAGNQSDSVSIKSIITEAVNARLEEAVISGVANAASDNTNGNPDSSSSSEVPGDGSTIRTAGSRRKAPSGNVGDFLSNKKLQISFKPSK